VIISKDKRYRTRSGSEARIYATDAGGLYSVHGAWKSSSVEWISCSWTREGAEDEKWNCDSDLIEARPRIKRTFWVNVRSDDVSPVHAHSKKEHADRGAETNRIACVEVTIDCEEGEGL
jgi:hypothetical protein